MKNLLLYSLLHIKDIYFYIKKYNIDALLLLLLLFLVAKIYENNSLKETNVIISLLMQSWFLVYRIAHENKRLLFCSIIKVLRIKNSVPWPSLTNILRGQFDEIDIQIFQKPFKILFFLLITHQYTSTFSENVGYSSVNLTFGPRMLSTFQVVCSSI